MRSFSSLFRGAVRWVVCPFRKKLMTLGPQIGFLEANRLFGSEQPFLDVLADGSQEELRLVLTGSRCGAVGEKGSFEPEEPNGALRHILASARPVVADEGLRCEIVFEQYILYQVRCESFADGDPKEVSQGRWLLICEESTLLSHLGDYTLAQRLADGAYFPGEWKHYEIITQRHIIDVVATGEPRIRWWKG